MIGVLFEILDLHLNDTKKICIFESNFNVLCYNATEGVRQPLHTTRES
jgi:hypothetical protein